MCGCLNWPSYNIMLLSDAASLKKYGSFGMFVILLHSLQMALGIKFELYCHTGDKHTRYIGAVNAICYGQNTTESG